MRSSKKKRDITALADRYGSNRMNAAEPGKLLKGCTCINVPFAGGMCELPHLKANVINVNDLDRAVINLGRTVRARRPWLTEQLDATLYHPDQLKASQAFCQHVERGAVVAEPFDLEWAYHYFIASWMTRGGSGGTLTEFRQAISVRWKSGGGDSVVRFRSAAASLVEWEKVMQRCTFTTLDAFDFLAECQARDIPENGIYVDADWPNDGEKYKHKIGMAGQQKLRDVLESFERTKIVVRYGDHPLIRELYPESRWTWNLLTGRTQTNGAKAEVLLTNWNPS